MPKLTHEHVKLTPYPVMNVKLAVQVLSSSVRKVLENFGPADATGTAEFCSLMDTFFDIVNIRNTKEAITKQKTQLAEFRLTNDPRFLWLTDVFLKYFEDWQTSIENRSGDFTKIAKNNVFIVPNI